MDWANAVNQARSVGIQPSEKQPDKEGKAWSQLVTDAKSSPQIPEQSNNMGLWVNPKITETIKNFPGSAARYAKDAFAFLMHPKRSAETLGQVAAGFVMKAFPGREPEEEMADQVTNFFKDRYGSVENLQKTIVEDPAGVMADVASVITPAGEAVGLAGKASGLSSVAKAGRVISKAGAATEPIQMMTEGALQAAKGVSRIGRFKDIPSSLYKSAAKFSTVLTKTERDKLSRVALDNNILPNIRGVEKIESKIRELDSTISSMIDDAQATGQKIPIGKLLKEYKNVRNSARLSGRPIEAMASVDDIAKQFIKANKEIDRKSLTPNEAQKLKQVIYRETESYYSNFKNSPASVKMQQSIAKSAKEAIEDILPEIKNLNRQDGDLIELKKAINRAANRIENRDVLSFGGSVRGAGGYMVTESLTGSPQTAAVVGITMALFDQPPVKARLAVIMHKLQNRGINISRLSPAVRLGLVQLERQVEDGGLR